MYMFYRLVGGGTGGGIETAVSSPGSGGGGQSGESSCGSPVTAVSGTTVSAGGGAAAPGDVLPPPGHSALDHSTAAAAAAAAALHLPPSWSILADAAPSGGGVKSEVRSPGLVEADVTALTQADPTSLYGAAGLSAAPGADVLGAVYDTSKEYPHQAYTTAHQYYNR